MKKLFSYKILTLVAVMALAFVLVSCSPSTEKTMEVTDLMDKAAEVVTEESMATETADEDTMDDATDEMEEESMNEMDTEMTFTLDELAQFDGTNGNAAYVAVDGVVYDVTDKPLWSGGTHNGNVAGRDLSEAILKSPHGKAKLKDLPVVGTLAEE